MKTLAIGTKHVQYGTSTLFRCGHFHIWRKVKWQTSKKKKGSQNANVEACWLFIFYIQSMGMTAISRPGVIPLQAHRRGICWWDSWLCKALKKICQECKIWRVDEKFVICSPVGDHSSISIQHLVIFWFSFLHIWMVPETQYGWAMRPAFFICF